MCEVLGSSESSQLGNLYLMKDWESKGACEGQKGVVLDVTKSGQLPMMKT